MKHSYKAYAAATQTMAKTKQIVLLYDAAIRYVQQAVEAIGNRQYEARYHALDKACAIIFGLQGALDFEKGGEIAQTLYTFYSSVDARLISIQRSNDVAMCEQVIKELKMMREAWAEIDAGDAGNQPDTAVQPVDSPASLNPPASSGVAISA